MTKLLLSANNAASTLAGSISDVATTATLATGTGARFPSPTGDQYFVMTFTDAATGLLNEIVHVTARTVDTITIVRAQEGTVALNWTAGDNADALWTSGQVQYLSQPTDTQAQAGNYAADSGTADAYAVTLDPVLGAHTTGLPIRVKIAHANTGASTFDPGPGAVAVKRPDGTALQANDLVAGQMVTFLYTGSVYQVYPNPTPAGLVNGECRLTLSGGNLVLSPYNGNRLLINGSSETVPSGGVSLSASGLSSSTFYYIYAYMNTGTMTLEASATAPTTDTTYGNKIKTGAATRSLVGAAFVTSGGDFSDTDGARYVLSWFSRQVKTSRTTFSANRSTASASFSELNAEIRNGFIVWSDDVVGYFINGSAYQPSAIAQVSTAIAFDGTSPEPTISVNATVTTPSVGSPINIASFKSGLSENASHYATLLGASAAGGTGTWFTADSVGTSGAAEIVLNIRG